MRVIRAMTPFLAAAALLAASAVAYAQPMPQPRAAPPPNSMPPPAYPNAGYGPPPPPPPYMAGPQYITRQGFTAGISVGVGAMGTDTGAIDCFDCDTDPMAGAMNLHVGYMITPRLALMVEYSGSFKYLDIAGYESFSQNMGLISAQYWVAPRIWLRGGIGAVYASLGYDDGFEVQEVAGRDGAAVSAAAGYEIFSGPRFAIDLQARLGAGLYQGEDYRDQITSAHVGVGFSWF